MHAARPLTDPLQVRRQGFSLLLLRWQQPNTLDDVPIPVLGWPPLHLGSWRRATSSSPRGKRKNGGGRVGSTDNGQFMYKYKKCASCESLPKGPFVCLASSVCLSLFFLSRHCSASSVTYLVLKRGDDRPRCRASLQQRLSLSLSPPLLKDLYTHTRRFAIFLFFPSNLGTSLQRRSATTPPCSRLQGFSCLRRWCSHS